VSRHTSTHHHVAPKPRFIITGFGRFCGVAQNPTEQLVGWLQKRSCHTKAGTAPAPDNQQEEHSVNESLLEKPYCISSLDVLEVSADAVDQFMQKQQEAILQQATAASSSAEGPQPVVLLHFGVDTQVGGRQMITPTWHLHHHELQHHATRLRHRSAPKPLLRM
jgi:hypothetical protein